MSMEIIHCVEFDFWEEALLMIYVKGDQTIDYYVCDHMRHC